MHDPNKKGKGKGRPHSHSPTKFTTPKLATTEVPEAHQNYRNSEHTTLYKLQGRKLPREKFMGMFPNVKHSKRKWTQIRRQVNLHARAESANEETNPDSVGRQDTIPSETSSYRKQVRCEKRKIGTDTWSHPDQISESTKSKRSNLRGKIHRMDLANGRKGKESSLDFTEERVQKFQIHILRIDKGLIL